LQKKIVSSHTANSKPVKQEVSGTVLLPPLVFSGSVEEITHCQGNKKLSIFKIIISLTEGQSLS
jgi:hypothetical protein